MTVGFAITGSFCTYAQVFPVMELLARDYRVIPIFSDEPTERVQISSSLSALTLITMILFAVCSVVVGIM